MRRLVSILAAGFLIVFTACLGAFAAELQPNTAARARESAETALRSALDNASAIEITVLDARPPLEVEVADDLKGVVRFLGVYPLPSKDPGLRLAEVQFLRYDDDTLFQVIVNLADMQVTEILALANANPRLGEVELVEAEEILRSSPEGQRILRSLPPDTQLDFVTTGIGDADHPLAGHRLVRILFHLDGQYFSVPALYVDISTRRVVTDLEQ